jgi:methylmalonyl-CoA mutase N-terminal domain/subunit
MDTMYQRGKIQEESLYYERKKHDGSLPIVGVNTFLLPDGLGEVGEIELMRSSEKEKNQQVANVDAFRKTHAKEAAPRLKHLQKVASERKNTSPFSDDEVSTEAGLCRAPHRRVKPTCIKSPVFKQSPACQKAGLRHRPFKATHHSNHRPH